VPAIGLSTTWGAEEWAAYVLEHLAHQSVLLQAGVRFLPLTGRVTHIPRNLLDGTAVWVAEGDEIPSSAPTGDELVLTPRKIANVVNLSNESISDAPVSELDAVGDALTRSVATALDVKAFSADVATAIAPAGLLASAIPAQAGGTVTVDPYISAIGKIEAIGGVASAIFLNPADKTTLALVKDAVGSERGLLQPDPTMAGAYSIGGARMWPTPAIAVGKALVAEARQIVIGVRKDISVEFSSDSAFTSDTTVARVVARFDIAFDDIRGAALVATP
jgi:HK97 family phage major capsid protein